MELVLGGALPERHVEHQLRVQTLGGVWGLGFGVYGLGCGFKVGFKAQGLGLKVWNLVSQGSSEVWQLWLCCH